MKKYRVHWCEIKSVIIEAESQEQAVDKAWDSDYDENKVRSEIDGSIEATEVIIQHGKSFCPRCNSTELSDIDGSCLECGIICAGCGEPLLDNQCTADGRHACCI